MMPTDLDRPAELTLWPGYAPARVADSRSFPTLRAALAAAVAAIDAEDASPWIITEDGDILAPGWIRANSAGPVPNSRPSARDPGRPPVIAR